MSFAGPSTNLATMSRRCQTLRVIPVAITTVGRKMPVAPSGSAGTKLQTAVRVGPVRQRQERVAVIAEDVSEIDSMLEPSAAALAERNHSVAVN